MSTLPVAAPQGSETVQSHAAPPTAHAHIAICLPSMPLDALTAMVERLRQLLPSEQLLIASPDQAEEQPFADGGGRLVPYPTHRTESEWVLTAADYLAAARLAEQRGLAGVLLLGTESATLTPASILSLRDALASGTDLVVPRYVVGAQEGLVNTALLYPLTRSLFGVDIRFPLPLDAGLSTRMLNRLASIAARAANQGDDALVWPVAEAAIAGYSVRQVEGIERSIPRPQENDLNVLFPAVTSSLFADLESKASYWQRARTLPAGRPMASRPTGDSDVNAEEVRGLVDNFRLAFNNLREIWALVLPPQTLLSMKKLSLSSPDSFTFPPSLWARVVYDFAISFHQRTLNRGHLLGAMTPVYLAWVASLLHSQGNGDFAQLEGTATAFEQEKPYLISRWRSPDRFNP